MALYWLDSGALIEAARGPYAFSRVPQFWSYLHERMEDGTCRMCRIAFYEIVGQGYNDDLESWCRSRRGDGLCCNETKEVQEHYGQIISLVQRQYGKKHPQHTRDFMSDADPWIIAYARATGGVVVTDEKENPARGRPIKLPSVAKVFDVRCITLWDMLEELNADLSGRQRR